MSQRKQGINGYNQTDRIQIATLEDEDLVADYKRDIFNTQETKNEVRKNWRTLLFDFHYSIFIVKGWTLAGSKGESERLQVSP